MVHIIEPESPVNHATQVAVTMRFTPEDWKRALSRFESLTDRTTIQLDRPRPDGLLPVRWFYVARSADRRDITRVLDSVGLRHGARGEAAPGYVFVSAGSYNRICTCEDEADDEPCRDPRPVEVIVAELDPRDSIVPTH